MVRIENESQVRVQANQKAQTQAKPVEAKVDIGAELLRTDNSTYTTGNVGAGADINLGKGWSVSPYVNGGLGKDVKVVNPELKLNKEINQNLSLNAGIGLRHVNFSQTKTSETTEVAGGEGYDMDGEFEFRHKGEYYFSGTQTETYSTKSHQNTLYGTLGTAYKPNSRLTFTGGVELGNKSTYGPSLQISKHYEGDVCTQGGEYIYNEEIGEYVFDGKNVQTAPFIYDNTETKRQKSKDFNANLKLGADYALSKQLSVGVTGNIGLNNKSDNFVGAKVSYKF